MADITLVANTNYSALSVSAGDRILLAGYTLTLDAATIAENLTIDAVGNAGRIVMGAPSSFTTPGLKVLCGTYGIGFFNIDKPISFVDATGGSATNAWGCFVSRASLLIGTIIGRGGSLSSCQGVVIQVANPAVDNAIGYGSAATQGIHAGSGRFVSLTGYGGAGAVGVTLSQSDATSVILATGYGANGKPGISNYTGGILDARGYAGTAAGEHGIVNAGYCRATVNHSNLAGAYGIQNFGGLYQPGTAFTGAYGHNAGHLILDGTGIPATCDVTNTGTIYPPAAGRKLPIGFRGQR